MDHKNFYQTLNVPIGASMEQIRAAFKRKAMELHPDKNPSEDAVRSFQKLNEAYSILSNPEKRERYNAGYDEEDIPDYTDIADIFQMFINSEFIFDHPGDEYESDPTFFFINDPAFQFLTPDYFSPYHDDDDDEDEDYDDFSDPEYSQIPPHLRFSPQVKIQDRIIVDWSKWNLPYDVMQYKLKSINMKTRIECTLYKGTKTKVAISELDIKEKFYFLVTAVISETEKISSLESKPLQIPSTNNKHRNPPKSNEHKQRVPHSENPNKHKENRSSSSNTKNLHSQKNDPKKSKNSSEKRANGTTTQPSPDLKETSSKPTDPKKSSSTKVCSYFKQGNCRNGTACKFLHQ